MRLKDLEGKWFAVPVEESTFASGLVARSGPKGVVLAYFFGPARPFVSGLDEVQNLEAGDAILVRRCGYPSLRSGRWPIIGEVRSWDREAWPMPRFHRVEEITGLHFLVSYDEEDPSRILGKEQVASDGVPADSPRDVMSGSRAVETVLSRLLLP